ncbi:MAG: cytochrome P450 [Myxococcales bacterium]|nr:cytochrome P450 [Myxococcales bacterium]
MTTIAPPPPRAAAWPLVGSGLDFLRDPVRFFHRTYTELGPIFRVQLGPRQLTVLAGPELNRMAFRDKGTLFSSRESWRAFGTELGVSRHLSSEDGPVHTKLRRTMRAGFSRAVISRRLPRATALTRRAMAGWTPKQPIDVLRFTRQVVVDQLGDLIVDRVPGPYFEDVEVYIRTLLNTTVLRKWPRAMLRLPRYRRAKERVRQLARFISDDVAARPRPLGRPSLVHDLLDAAAEDDELFENEAALLMCVTGPFVAGMDTAANTAAFVLYALMSQPDVLRRIRAENATVWTDAELPADALKRMPLLRATVLEALRMWPVAPALPRHAATDFTFAGHGVAAGEELLLATTVTHYLPECFPQPDRFDIDRYAPPRNEHQRGNAFAPFGIGAHICLGQHLAMAQLMVLVATVVRHADVRLPEGFTLSPALDPILTPGRGFSMQLHGWRSPCPST